MTTLGYTPAAAPVALAFALAFVSLGDAEGLDRAMRLFVTATLAEPAA